MRKNLRITIVALGSQGDVQPYVALGMGLQAAGHKVRLATHSHFEMLTLSKGLDCFPIESNPLEVLETEEGLNLLNTGSDPLRYLYRLFRVAGPLLQQATIGCWNACQDSDAIVFSQLCICPAYPVAEKLGVPYCMASLQPLTPTNAFASPFFPKAPDWFPFGIGKYNQLTHFLCAYVFWQLARPSTNKARREVLNLPPLPSRWLLKQLRQQHVPILYGYSPSVLPQPLDWSESNSVTGYWFLNHPSDWQPPADLVDFLTSGPPPVYIGFGSMKNNNPEEVTKTVLKALARSKQRGILLTGWGGMSKVDLSDQVYLIDAIPHDWLFPQMAAVVHHGGAGTTAAQLRAGIPAAIVPFFADQPFWARRIFELGVGSKPIPRRWLSEERLAEAIYTITCDEGIRARARALSERIGTEDGVARAVEILECHLGVMR